MDNATVALIRISAALGARDTSALADAMDEASEAAEASEIEEALLQSYLLVGFPAAMNAFALWRERSGRMAPEPTLDTPATWPERGESACRAIYGGQYEPLRANVARLHPDLDRWMVLEGYGKVLSRPGLSPMKRELCSVAVLVGLDAPRQLYAHFRGALRMGASAKTVEDALDVIARVVPDERVESARTVWREIRVRAGGG